MLYRTRKLRDVGLAYLDMSSIHRLGRVTALSLTCIVAELAVVLRYPLNSRGEIQ